MPEEQDIIQLTRTVFQPALSILHDGTLLTEISTNHPWTKKLSSSSSNDEVDAAFRISPNDMTITLSEYVDAFYGLLVIVKFQNRTGVDLYR